MAERCETCRWWHSGECRRYPPTLVLWPQDNQHPISYFPAPAFPSVAAVDWCGEWTAREVKA